jgi:TraX protein
MPPVAAFLGTVYRPLRASTALRAGPAPRHRRTQGAVLSARRARPGQGDKWAARSGVLSHTITSGARGLLKWIALVLMTGDHVAKVLGDGYIPVVSELGRIAFPLFALVLAYNLAQPGADLLKSVRRLLLWGTLAQPAYGFAFGDWLPFNVLLSFALAAAVIWSIQRRQWTLLGMCVLAAPPLVDYNWAGLILILAAWWRFRLRAVPQVPLQTPLRWTGHRAVRGAALVLSFGPLCWWNGNGWALLALPLAALLTNRDFPIPQTRWAFYLYYVGHLALLAIAGRATALHGA